MAIAPTPGMNNNAMNGLTKTLIALVIIGAINWGLVGFFEWNLVAALFTGSGVEEASIGSRIVYALVGLAGLFVAFVLPRVRADLGTRPAHRPAGA